MKNVISVIAATVLSISASSAFAITHKSGVISEVDLSNNVLKIENANGSRTEYKINADTKVWVDGEMVSASALVPNQEVTLKIPSSAKEESKATYVRAEIIALDMETGLATVKPVGKESTVEIKLHSATKVSGKVSSLDDLAEGQYIKYRLASNM